MTLPTCFCGLPAPGVGEPGVHVEIAGQMDPVALGYALDELRHLASHYPRPVDRVRLTLRSPAHPDHVIAEATMAAGERVVRAHGTAGGPRGAVDAILRQLSSSASRSALA